MKRPNGKKNAGKKLQHEKNAKKKRKGIKRWFGKKDQGKNQQHQINRDSRKSQGRERQKKQGRTTNKEFARVTYFFVILFIALMGYLVYFSIVRAKLVVNSPYNQRQDAYAQSVIRGKLVDKNGNTLAETVVDEDGNESRNYPYGELFAHVIGYSNDKLGKTGLESVENFELLTSNAFFIEKLKNEFSETKNMGDTVVTTLDADLQQAAYQALGENKGAVVVMEAATGKILAMVSKPAYDPNNIVAAWSDLNSDDTNSPLLNRATQGSYAPGSTFKVVTALSYIRQNASYRDYTYDCNGEITEGDITIHCFGGHAHGQEDLRSSFANSCNASFANIGLQLDISQYKKTAEDMLFNKSLPGDLNTSKSSFALDSSSGSGEIMMTAMGQGKTTVSPYHMALIAEAVANRGNRYAALSCGICNQLYRNSDPQKCSEKLQKSNDFR